MILTATTAHATGEILGLGLSVGIPTGISFTVSVKPARAPAASLVYDILHANTGVPGRYIYHFERVAPGDTDVTLRPSIGGGGCIVFRFKDDGDENWVAERNPVEEAYFPLGVGGSLKGGARPNVRRAPLEIFVDVSPGIWLDPAMDFHFGADAGVRYQF